MNRDLVVVVTGSSGRLGGALAAKFSLLNNVVVFGIDPLPGPLTTHNTDDVEKLFAQLDTQHRGKDVVVFHAGALHKPQVKTHTPSQFVELNVQFTLRMIEAALRLQHARFRKFIYTSTTSVYGAHFASSGDGESGGCWWVAEGETVPNPKNIYGWSKLSAEGLVALYAQRSSMKPNNDGGSAAGASFCVLRACRFFPEEDDGESVGGSKEDVFHDEDNLKWVHALTGRRLTLRDVVGAHVAAYHVQSNAFFIVNLGNAVELRQEDCQALASNAQDVLLKRYESCGIRDVLSVNPSWKLPKAVDRVYDASLSFEKLQWRPIDTPNELCKRIAKGEKIEW